MSIESPLSPVSDMSLGDRITLLENQVAGMRTTLDSILEQISAISGAVAPTLAQLSTSPIGKMLGI